MRLLWGNKSYIPVLGYHSNLSLKSEATVMSLPPKLVLNGIFPETTVR